MTRSTRNMRRTLGLGAAAVGLAVGLATLSGCEDWTVQPGCAQAPHAPVDVYSVTGDGEVFLYWTPVDGARVDYFVVYRSPRANGTYTEVGHSRDDGFTDHGLENGRTYYYAVTAVNRCGDESDLSREVVHDTPRPEGFGAVIRDAGGPYPDRSGWQFSDYRAVPWDYAGADVYFIVSDGTPYLVATDTDTDIQDAGYVDFDTVDWAPDGGWSPTGTVEVVPGHTYVVWTRNDHFAKVHATSADGGVLRFDWGYQVDRGNPELGPRPPRETVPQGLRPGTGVVS